MRTARFQVYKVKDGWRWRLLAANNRKIAQGEAHTRKADALRAIEAVKSVVGTIGDVHSRNLSVNVVNSTDRITDHQQAVNALKRATSAIRSMSVRGY